MIMEEIFFPIAKITQKQRKITSKKKVDSNLKVELSFFICIYTVAIYTDNDDD